MHPSSLSASEQKVQGIELSINDLIYCKSFADRLQLPTNQKVKTHLLGGFMSHFKGRGMDFDESRMYQQGDDIRSIDWRVTARTGEAHTKIYREERERPVFVVMDQSPSMMFGSRNQFKSYLAAQLTSLIMWSSLSDGNRFGCLLFDQNHHKEFKPSSSRKPCLRILNYIVDNHNQQLERIYSGHQINTESNCNLSHTLKRTRQVSRPGSLIYLLSDCRQLDTEAQHHLVRLAQYNDVCILLIHDPIEMDLPPPGQYSITDGDNISLLDTRSQRTRERFHKAFENFQIHLQQVCIKHQIKLTALSTQKTMSQLIHDIMKIQSNDNHTHNKSILTPSHESN